MFCPKCGKKINGEGNFCFFCGTLLQAAPPPMAAQNIPNIPVPPIAPQAIAPSVTAVSEEGAVTEQASYAAVPEVDEISPDEPIIPELAIPEMLVQEKQYFGKPALVFCLALIGILSAACGVLATLYFGGF